ncbi:MAG: hypothetical protein J6K32_07955 [Clostridia bacterium]|nr:hypothetical protein [Clostridia bacterium]
MKKLTCILLLAAMLLGCAAACAESAPAYTGDELAYVAYMDIDSAYWHTIRYLDTIDGLWESLLDIHSYDDVDTGWMLEYIVAGGDMDESVQRVMMLNKIAETFYDPGDSNDFIWSEEFVDGIKALAQFTGSTNPKDVIWTVLFMAQEADRLCTQEEVEAELENGFAVIREITQTMPDYAHLGALKDYYKEASALAKYAYDFSDNYQNFTAMLRQGHTGYDGWAIEFDLILGENKYSAYGDAYSRYTKARGE